jgi:hypothetical protein
MLLEIVMPIILIVGCLGNLLSVYIFTRPSVRGLSTFRFLAYLSAVDLLYLLVGLPHIIVLVYSNYDFRIYSDLICSVHSFLTLYLSHVSSNLLAGVGIFRCVTITRLRHTTLGKKRPPQRPQQQQLRVSGGNNKQGSVVTRTTGDNIDNQQSSQSNKATRQLKYQNSVHTRVAEFARRASAGCGDADVMIVVLMLVVFAVDSHFLVFMRLNEFNESSQDLLANTLNSSLNGTGASYDNAVNASATAAVVKMCYPSPETQKVTFFKDIFVKINSDISINSDILCN